jgi:hypothetical protein
VSPIFVRPVREQLEHDRLIRFLQAKYKRKFDVSVNVGDEQTAPVKIGQSTFFPDLVLTSGKKLAGLVEVESSESVNNLEAMAQWVHFSQARVPFSLYVPVPMYDTARRLSEANHVRLAEIWTYRFAPDGFDLVRVFNDPAALTAPPARRAKPVKEAKPAATKATPSKSSAPKPASRVAASKPAPRRAAKSVRAAKRSKPAAKSAKKARKR